MSPPGLPFVNVISDGKSKGRRWYYFRSAETGNVKLPGAPGEPAFLRAYADAAELRERIRAKAPIVDTDPASFAFLVDRYLASAEFRALADDTQTDYSRTCALLKEELRDPVTKASLAFRYVTRAMLKALRDEHATRPRKANKIQQMSSRLYSWGNEADLVPDGCNPAIGLKKLKRKGGEREIVPWSDAEIAWIQAAAPAHVLTPVLVALYTGQRREDVVSMTWQQWQGEAIHVRQSKTRALLELPCHPALKAHLEHVRSTSKVVSLAGAICLAATGAPFTVNGLSGALRRVVEKHERVPNNRSMHGLRYAAAARMEEGGATVAAIEAVLGHRTFKMALKYASARMRAREGVAAMQGGKDA